MTQTLTISLAQPVAACRVVDASGHDQPVNDEAESEMSRIAAKELAALKAEQLEKMHVIEAQEQNLTHLCETLDDVAGKLSNLYEQTLIQNRSDIAKLAVEIARKILGQRTQNGDYDIHAIIEEALKRAPTRQELVVRVNPEDLPRCQQLQQAKPDSPFAELSFVADHDVTRASCLIETPKGVVRSFVEEHLNRIAEALEKAQ
jgi:flagellar biosynthesis/type III secretory pathway protein FliH